VHKDDRSPILVSTLAPGTYSLAAERRSIVCPDCQTWRRVRKGAIFPHNDERGATCESSRRAVWFDLDAQQEAVGRFTLELAGHDAAQRRRTRTHVKPKPEIPVPVAYLGRDRTPRRAQIAGWTEAELSETALKYANTATAHA
jgi:hypothetical protein